MCGIAGILMKKGKPDSEVISSLAASLSHRGPDGSGRYDYKDTVVLHKRLSIIDLETGDQPIHNQNGSVIVVNGEIYNFIELRKTLGENNFRTKSDCEPPLMLYDLNGVEFVQQLRGMFAIAVVDVEHNQVHLARDPFGIKPLYYTKFENGVAFASEAGSLLDAGLAKRTIHSEKQQELLELKFTTGADTIFSAIKRVMPGQTLTLDGGGINYQEKYSALSDFGPVDLSEKEALKNLDEVLMDSVKVHQRSDVPYGMFLSGGIDSSVILACMRELNENPVEAFTAGFSETSAFDERDHAKAVANAAGAHFNNVEFSEDDFWALTPSVVSVMDDPAADYAILPTYKLGQVCRNAGLKVVLSGEGGDELFAGYGRYRRQIRPWFLGGRNMRSQGVLQKLGLLRNSNFSPKSLFDEAWLSESKIDRTTLQIAQAVDCADWLPHDLLVKLDRCLMAHGVEGRTPFLDQNVAEFAMRLPDKLKIRGRIGKYLLRTWLEKKMPEARAFERKKGFTVPVAEWMGRRGSTLGKLVAKQESIHEICEASSVENLFSSLEGSAVRRNGQAAWVLLFYALWHRRHVEGITPAGDIFEVLAV